MFWDCIEIIASFLANVLSIIFAIRLSDNLTLGGVITLLILATALLKIISQIIGVNINLENRVHAYKAHERKNNKQTKGDCK